MFMSFNKTAFSLVDTNICSVDEYISFIWFSMIVISLKWTFWVQMNLLLEFQAVDRNFNHYNNPNPLFLNFWFVSTNSPLSYLENFMPI